MTSVDERRQAPACEPKFDPEFGLDVARGWFPRDAASHRRDAPRYCPQCAAPLALAEGGHGLATEYWVGGDRVFVCFCGACSWSGDIVLAARVVGHEAEH
jgi:fatty acid desaturase